MFLHLFKDISLQYIQSIIRWHETWGEKELYFKIFSVYVDWSLALLGLRENFVGADMNLLNSRQKCKYL